jgi:hypothetical protein
MHPDISWVGGTAEVAEVLNCPKQQIHALRKLSAFPKPIHKVAATPLWDLEQIRLFGSTWRRRKTL